LDLGPGPQGIGAAQRIEANFEQPVLLVVELKGRHGLSGRWMKLLELDEPEGRSDVGGIPAKRGRERQSASPLELEMNIGNNSKHLFLLATLIAGVGWIVADRVAAQTFTVLHSFTALSSGTNSDGTEPRGGLIVSGNTLYGTASGGGQGAGTVFKVNTDGRDFTTLHRFTALSTPYAGSNMDGANPQAGLVLSGNTLYGTTQHGGSTGNGTVFKIKTDGTGFTNLHTFTATSSYPFVNSDGANALAELVLSGNTLYGTTCLGGSSGVGTVFAINTDGTGFTNLHSFTYGDGANPQTGVILSGKTLYGTAQVGGSLRNGTVFRVDTDGTGFATLHNFSGGSGGVGPGAGLIVSGNTLYGTASLGGSSSNGTVFAVATDGTAFTNLHSFSASGSASFSPPTNGDGAFPDAGLIVSGNTLYGTASGGGQGAGTVFKVNTDGRGFTVLHAFTVTQPERFGTNSDGAYPYAGLISSGNTLYGTTQQGGSKGYGTVFSLPLPAR
jgi:uncharacterized repeat protein (TIGR03803 family)